jgi:hypothetical protein
MISGVLSPFVSLHYPKPSEKKWSLTSISQRASVDIKAADKLKLPVFHLEQRALTPQYWNCMAQCDPNTYAFSSGKTLFSLRDSNVAEIKSASGLQTITEVIGNRDLVACRDLSGSVQVLTPEMGGDYASVHKGKYSKNVRMASTSGGYFSISNNASISAFDLGSPNDPIFTFSEGGGPVTYSSDNPNMIFHGTMDCISCLDLREGMQVSSLRGHPAAVSLTAYLSTIDYQVLSSNPRNPFELAAMSHAHCTVQFFDTRQNRSAVSEIPLPGREDLHQLSAPSLYKYMAFSPDGQYLAAFFPSATSCVVIKPGYCYEEIPLVPEPKQETTPKAGRTKRSVVTPFPYGVCWNGNERIMSVCGRGTIHCTERSSKQETNDHELSRNKNSKSKEDVVFSLKSVSKGLDLILNNRSKPPVVDHLTETDRLWIQCQIGLIESIGGCTKHPLASKSKPGSYRWNQCVRSSSCQRDAPIQAPEGFRKTTSVGKITEEYLSLYEKFLSKELVLQYLETLGDKVRIINYGCPVVEVNIEPEPVVPAITLFEASPDEIVEKSDYHDSDSDGGESGIMTQKKVLEKPKLLITSLPKDIARNRLVDKSLIEELRLSYGIHPPKTGVATPSDNVPLPDFNTQME